MKSRGASKRRWKNTLLLHGMLQGPMVPKHPADPHTPSSWLIPPSPGPAEKVFPANLFQKPPYLQQKATAQLPGCCGTTALQRRHIDKTPRTKAPLSCQFWMHNYGNGLILYLLLPPCTRPPPETGTKSFGLSRCCSCAKAVSRDTVSLGAEVSPACKSLQSK